MLNLEYHKGELCTINSKLCQEGFCSECIIYLERSASCVNSVRMPKKFSSKIPSKTEDYQNLSVL
jgi:hypothetical protein